MKTTSKWYALYVASGQELEVACAVGRLAWCEASAPLVKYDYRGAWRIEPLFSAYVFVHCDLTPALYYQLIDIKGVIRILGVTPGMGKNLGVDEKWGYNIAKQVGFNHPRILRGADLNRLSDASLRYHAARTQIFAEIEPNAKERVVRSLRRSGNVVGYMGDGINDAAALHSADVGISVEGAVDVAKEAADMVLLEKDLGVLVDGVEQGRRTFANTLKYVFMASSANFGNMFSMAGASLLLPFLPLLPQQILLTNLLTDLPEMTIPTDNVSRELVQTPRRWNLVFIRRFMLTFGLVSSVFDYLTFAILLWLLKAAPEEFRTGWFVESVVSASLIVLVVRTRRAFYRSWPSWPLLLATLSVVVLTMALPYMPFAVLFGFVPLPPAFLAAVLIIALFYIAGAEVTKRYFYFRMAKR